MESIPLPTGPQIFSIKREDLSMITRYLNMLFED